MLNVCRKLSQGSAAIEGIGVYLVVLVTVVLSFIEKLISITILLFANTVVI